MYRITIRQPGAMHQFYWSEKAPYASNGFLKIEAAFRLPAGNGTDRIPVGDVFVLGGVVESQQVPADQPLEASNGI